MVVYSGVWWPAEATVYIVLAAALAMLIIEALGLHFIPNNRVGIVERLWSPEGSVASGQIIALGRKAGLPPICCAVVFTLACGAGDLASIGCRWTVVPQGEIGYVYARDGEPLAPSQTLGRIVPCNNFQDAQADLQGADAEVETTGQRGRRGTTSSTEGVYAVNLTLFIIITKDTVYQLALQRTGRSQDGRQLAARIAGA